LIANHIAFGTHAEWQDITKAMSIVQYDLYASIFIWVAVALSTLILGIVKIAGRFRQASA
jgi:hypothetical protein